MVRARFGSGSSVPVAVIPALAWPRRKADGIKRAGIRRARARRPYAIPSSLNTDRAIRIEVRALV